MPDNFLLSTTPSSRNGSAAAVSSSVDDWLSVGPKSNMGKVSTIASESTITDDWLTGISKTNNAASAKTSNTKILDPFSSFETTQPVSSKDDLSASLSEDLQKKQQGQNASFSQEESVNTMESTQCSKSSSITADTETSQFQSIDNMPQRKYQQTATDSFFDTGLDPDAGANNQPCESNFQEINLGGNDDDLRDNYGQEDVTSNDAGLDSVYENNTMSVNESDPQLQIQGQNQSSPKHVQYFSMNDEESPERPAKKPISGEFNYGVFFQTLKHPSVQPIVERTALFVKQVNAVQCMEKKPSLINSFQTFLPKLHTKLLECEVYEECDDEFRDNYSYEGLEKFITTKVYPTLFNLRDADAKKDRALAAKLVSLRWISLSKHLEMPERYTQHKNLFIASDFFLKLDDYRSPRDKLICLQNACKVLMTMLQETSTSQSTPTNNDSQNSDVTGSSHNGTSGQQLGSIDDLLPVLIYVLIQSNPPNLWSNLEYIQNFRRPDFLIEDARYCLVMVRSGVEFLCGLSFEGLSNVTPDEFDSFCEEELRKEGISMRPDLVLSCIAHRRENILRPLGQPESDGAQTGQKSSQNALMQNGKENNTGANSQVKCSDEKNTAKTGSRNSNQPYAGKSQGKENQSDQKENLNHKTGNTSAKNSSKQTSTFGMVFGSVPFFGMGSGNQTSQSTAETLKQNAQNLKNKNKDPSVQCSKTQTTSAPESGQDDHPPKPDESRQKVDFQSQNLSSQGSETESTTTASSTGVESNVIPAKSTVTTPSGTAGRRILNVIVDQEMELMLTNFQLHFTKHKMDTLTIKEVPQLLWDYKQLAKFFSMVQQQSEN